MPAFAASAPGKIILFGEHAVVYGQPAIAVPVSQVKTRALITPNPAGSTGFVRIQAPDIGLDAKLEDLPADNPLLVAINLVIARLGVDRLPACTVRISSTIPVAAGLGSGAAVAVAMIRAVSAFLGHRLPDERVSALAYEVEKIHHGTPSGIDNTVITYALPVFYIRHLPIETLTVPREFTILIGDTGVSSPTSVTVGDVRRSWQAEPDRYDAFFHQIGNISQTARLAIEEGQPEKLGLLMDQNHELLQKLDVSSPELDRLVESARFAGALGAKLSGGGRGGNMIALVRPDSLELVANHLRIAGAVRTIPSIIHRHR